MTQLRERSTFTTRPLPDEAAVEHPEATRPRSCGRSAQSQCSSATSFVFLAVSEHQPLFGCQESGYRTAIVVANR